MAQRRNSGSGALGPPPEGLGDEFEPAPAPLDQELLGDLALLTGAEFQDVDWYIYRLRTKAERDANPGCKARELVLKRSGVIDLAEIGKDIGGGDFDFYPLYDEGDGLGKRIHPRQRHAFAGPRKDFSSQPAPVTAAAPAAAQPVSVGTTDPAIARLLEKIMERLERLESPRQSGLDETLRGLATLDALRLRNLPATPAGMGMQEVLTMVQTIMGLIPTAAGGKEPDPVKVAAMMLETLTKGIEIGQAREPITVEGNGQTDYGPVIEKGLEIVGQLLNKNRVQRPPPPPPPPPGQNGAPPHTPSEARVVEATEVVTPPTQPTAAMHRWMTATEALYRAMLNRVEPADFADTLESGASLNEEEVEQLRNSSVDLVLGYLAPLLAQYPDLKTEQGKVYLTSVLAALRQESEDDPEGTPAAE